MRFVVREQIRGCAAAKFFKLLGQLAGYAKLPILHDIAAGFERFGQSIRRFKVDRSLVAGGGSAQLAFALPAFDREKSSEEKFLARKSGAHKRGRNRRGSRNNCERQFAFNAFANQSCAGIGKPWRSGIGNERDFFAGRESVG